MDVDSGESDASLDYDAPKRKGKGKAPKKKDKGKSKVTEVSTVHRRLGLVAVEMNVYETRSGSLRVGGIVCQVLGYGPRG